MLCYRHGAPTGFLLRLRDASPARFRNLIGVTAKPGGVHCCLEPRESMLEYTSPLALCEWATEAGR